MMPSEQSGEGGDASRLRALSITENKAMLCSTVLYIARLLNYNLSQLLSSVVFRWRQKSRLAIVNDSNE